MQIKLGYEKHTALTELMQKAGIQLIQKTMWSINFIDDTDDEGLGEEKHKLMDKKQVRSQWILTIL